MMKTKLLFLLGLTVSYFSMAQNVNIPDAAFKAALVGNSMINTNGDAEIQVSEATAFSGSFNAIGLGITDLTGIEAFVNLTAFSASNNMITTVDLSQNTSLVEVRLVGNQLASIDVSQLTDLIFLQLSNNPITSIDVSNNPDLENLLLNNGQLTAIDMTANLALRQLEVADNQLTTLNVTGLTMLTDIIVSRNQIASIDLSTNSQLNFVRVDANNLTSFNIANGNNTNISTLFADLNPNLSCITIDAGFTPPSLWFVDATASFSANCPPPVSVIYVDKDATGNNDGTSWQDAYIDFGTAISNANTDDSIWVAEGVYNPTSTTSGFTIDKGIKIYGGFAGTETQLSDRVFGANETIFSGDINCNDAAVRPPTTFTFPPSSKQDNALTIFFITDFSTTSPTIFDGISVTHAFGGAAVNIWSSVPTIPNIEFHNCKFKYNGGNSISATSINFFSTTETVKFTINQCVFEKNSGLRGAGFWAYSQNGSPGTIAGQKVEFTISNSLFEGNATNQDPSGTATVSEGSAYYIDRRSDHFDFRTKSVNNTFVNNIDPGDFTTTVISNNTSSDNFVNYYNNIFWNNTNNGSTTSKAFRGFLVTPTIANCVDPDNFSNIPDPRKSNIVTTDPLFTNSASSDFTLQATSPAVDSGDNTEVIGTLDLLNNPRIESTTVDMGAYERPSCTVTIPDAVFKSALLAHGSSITGTNVSVIDTNGDGEIQCDEASAYTGRLILNNNNAPGISDLTGIEAFINVPYLLVDGQSLTTLDLSSNTLLEFVSVNNNSLTSLDVSANVALLQLEVRNNSLVNIDVTQNPNLEILDVFGCNLTTLNVSQNSVLTSLSIGNNNLSSVDLSSNVNLDSFFTEGNPNVTNIDVSNNVNLFRFEVDNTFLTDIDLSNNSILGEVSITDNANLSSVNLANGNNGSITSADFTTNPNLLCIQIDTGFTPPSSWMQDTSVIYNENCSSALSVDDDLFAQETKVYPNPVTSVVYVESSRQIETIEVYSLLGKKLLRKKDVTQIDISKLSKGVYLLKITDKNNATVVKRLIKD